MKKCPFCKADIEDTARFCLYCMKPLNEKEVVPPPQRKKPWWLFVLAAVLPIALAAVILFVPRENENLAAASTHQTTGVQTTDASTQNSQNEGDAQQENTSQKEDQKPAQDQNSDTPKPTKNTPPATKPTTPTTPTTKPTTPTTKPTSPTPAPQETTQPEETTETEETTVPEETTAPEKPKTEVVYTYRAARAGDDFNAQYQNSGNDIVITGLSQPASDGVYDIPSRIDGKKVIAIVANAFSGSNAKTVYVPTTVKTIWNYAFAGCGLKHIFFRGNAIYVESKTFDSKLTIHCSTSCSDRNFRYYKDCAASYGATWKEWNG